MSTRNPDTAHGSHPRSRPSNPRAAPTHPQLTRLTRDWLVRQERRGRGGAGERRGRGTHRKARRVSPRVTLEVVDASSSHRTGAHEVGVDVCLPRHGGRSAAEDSACEGRRSNSWGARPPPETERPANPGGVGVRGRRRQPRTCVLRARFLALAAHAVKGYSAFMVLGMNDLSTQLSGCFSVVPRGDRAFFASAPPRK